MLRIYQNNSANGAKSYFSTADYYSEGQELVGRWRGEGAKLLGLSGTIEKRDWDALCDNIDPRSGKTLTARQKQDRRVGYDFNFNIPKSASVLFGLTKDPRIVEAVRAAADETMHDVERDMKTRVRRDGKNEDRTTQNLVWGEYVHYTSRPVEGIPDPNLHLHAFCFNTTWDAKEGRWKAGQFADIKRDGPYYEGLFHARLSRRMEELGLEVERTAERWELVGMPKSASDKLSRRTTLIEQLAKEKGIVNSKEKDQLGAKTREEKAKNLSFTELQATWRSWLSGAERAEIERVAKRIGGPRIREQAGAAREAVDWAVEHCFERKSALPERTVLAAALNHGAGKASAESVVREFQRWGFLSAEHEGRRFITTPNVWAEEKGMLDFAREGRGTLPALAPTPHVFSRDWLNDGQRKAVEHVLGSHDRVTLVRGAAGVGKTSMMQEAVEAVEANGTKVMTFAPSAEASRGVLRAEGFKDADTVARLLADPRLQEEAKGAVWWIDEAGLLGTRTTARVFELAEKLDARIVLSGDRRQHGSVERGAALRLLETEAGLIPAEIKEIQRQKGSYKQVVDALAEGRTEDGFDQLDKLGWIKEINSDERYKVLASEYVAAVNGGKSALVVSPTHLEGEAITDEIRSELRRSGKLGKQQRQFRILQNADLTVAQRRDAVNYSPGDILVYHQNAKGHRRGQQVIVGPKAELPLAQAERFQVYQESTLSLSAGDVIRITRNGSTADGEHRLNNGARYTVKGFVKNGDIELTNGWAISKEAPFFTYGYVVTSNSSQGKTVDRVFVGSSSISSPAASREQLYVSVSRARERAIIFTDDKEALKEAVSQSDERLSATELLGMRERRERHATLERQEQREKAVAEPVKPEREREGLDHER